jgi:hypothetical protein
MNLGFKEELSAALKASESNMSTAMDKPTEYKIGQVWGLAVPSGVKAFVLTYVDNEDDEMIIGGIPLCENWKFATPSDLICAPDDGLPSFCSKEWTMLELGLEIPLPVEAFAIYIGEVSSELFSKIQTLLSWLDGRNVERNFISSPLVAIGKESAGFCVEQWEIKDPVTSELYKVYLGQQIIHKDDPRIKFKETEFEDLVSLQGMVMQKFIDA